MIKIKQTYPIFILLLSIFFTNCTSPGQQLRKYNPQMHDDIVGTWYVLSNDEPGKLKGEVSFNENGTVTDNFGILKQPKRRNFQNSKKITWDYKYYAPYRGYSLNGHRNYNAKRGRFVYEYKTGRGNLVSNVKINVFYRHTPSQLKEALKRINSRYHNYIPPLKVMRIVYNSNFRGEATKQDVYLFSRNKEDIYNLFKKVEQDANTEKQLWDSTNKESVCSAVPSLVKFLKVANHEAFKNEAKERLNNLLDDKTKEYLKKYHHSFFQYANNEIAYRDGGSTNCKLFEFLRTPILGKNPTTGLQSKVSIEKINTDSFMLTLAIEGEKSMYFTFRPYKNKLIVTSLRQGYLKNPPRWEGLFQIIISQLSQYPELDYINLDLIKKLK